MASIIEQYEKETGKSVWEKKNYTYTKEYVEWLKCFVKTSDSPAAKIVRIFSQKINKQ